MEQQTGSKLEKEYVKVVYCHPIYLTYIQSIMWNARMDEAQAELKIPGRNINNFRNANGTTLMAESEEVLKSFLMRVKEQSKKDGWKLNFQNTKLMASGTITSWQKMGKQWKQRDFIFLGSKIMQMVTAAMIVKDACSLEEKLWLT